ncbi:NIPSNAP family protein [Spirosoma sp. SC4-14]|uniref:NIPSNAP family protein n=1 Tax=Spirosoma sp. SC4-14 TaxID=3128900 RepID=UPI0030D15AE3
MKRVSKIALVCLLCFVQVSFLLASAPTASREFYELKVYHLKSDAQEATVDNFLEKAYLPALHRAGIAKVGVFKPRSDANSTTEKLIYVFIPFRSSDDFFKLEQKLASDKTYQNDGKEYLDAVYTNPPFERIETILLNAFEKAPHYTLPELTSPKKDRVYELRSYESHTEKISKNKIDMFNKGDEVGLFKRLGFNAVFYAEVVAGSRMPNLMYLTTFDNKTSRDQHWDAFGKDDYWKKLSAMPQYQKNVSRNDMRFLYPTDYSDI